MNKTTTTKTYANNFTTAWVVYFKYYLFLDTLECLSLSSDKLSNKILHNVLRF